MELPKGKTLWICSGLAAGLAGVVYLVVRKPVVREPVVKATPPPTLDKGISVPEAHAVAVALARENNSSNLLSFGNAMLPTYPVAAGLLLTKSRLLSVSGKIAAASKVSGELHPAVQNAVEDTLFQSTEGLGTLVQSSMVAAAQPMLTADVPKDAATCSSASNA